jgi:hypothetical protein
LQKKTEDKLDQAEQDLKNATKARDAASEKVNESVGSLGISIAE